MRKWEFTPTEKGADLAWMFCLGRTFTALQVAQEYGITPQGARVLLKAVSRVVPIVDLEGVWQKI